ncbi:MAG: hypothetical protein F6J93_25860 [Oscillatoria sp. SIO1A7]|nr:hypothetical protein [Oscillatoria sp. SIO1A7]
MPKGAKVVEGMRSPLHLCEGSLCPIAPSCMGSWAKHSKTIIFAKVVEGMRSPLHLYEGPHARSLLPAWVPGRSIPKQ